MSGDAPVTLDDVRRQVSEMAKTRAWTVPPVSLNPLPTDDLEDGEIGLLAGGA